MVAVAVCVGLTAPPASAILWRVSKHHVVSYAGILGKAHPTNVAPRAPSGNLSNFDATNHNLDYSGGPVMPSSTNVIVVWKPSGSQSFDEGVGEGCGAANNSGQYIPCLGYEAGLTQFFQDLAAASGQTTNSDAVSTQYNDTAGHWAGGPSPGHYSSTYGGLLTDTDPYPQSGCPGAPQGGVCLTDGQLQAELQHFLSQNNEPVNSMTREYFLVTPPGVASCLGQDSHQVWQCSGNIVQTASVNPAFCAYHSRTATTGHFIYANVPDMDNVDGCDPFVTNTANSDLCTFDTCIWNQSTAEGVLSAVSHEHNESVTDPEPNNAWTDWGSSVGGENGDKCNNDGLDDPNLVSDRSHGNDGLLTVTPYNEIINGHYYLIQREWSNDGAQCLDGWSALNKAFPAPTFIVSGRNGTAITFNAGASCTGNVACPSGSEYVWQFNDDIRPGDSPQNATVESTSPTISHTFPRGGAYTVALTVMGPSGLSQGTAQTIRVYAKPVVRIAATTTRLAGAPIRFSSTGTTHDPSLTVSRYAWQFGDGATSTVANPTHTYARAGRYTVRLTVTDSAGQTGSAAGSLTVAASCRVPNVKGRTQSSAKSAITAAGCTLGSVHKPARKTGSKLVVGSQSPSAGSVVRKGTAVNLTMVWR